MMEGKVWCWLNEPAEWHQTDDGLQVVTDKQTDFWRSTWYGFERFSGHLYAAEVAGDFTLQAKICADFTTLYDQAGLMMMRAVAPLLGLLGTVMGIIESFLMIDVGTNSDPVLMMPGISKALITTAAGMFIAIPALFAHRYFQRLVQEYVAELEQQATLFHAALYYQNTTDEASQDLQKAS